MGLAARSCGVWPGGPMQIRNRSVVRVVVAVVLTVVGVGAVGSATAVTPVRHVLLERHETVERARELRRQQQELEDSLRRRIAAMERAAHAPSAHGVSGEQDRRVGTISATRALLEIARTRLRSLDPWARERLHALRARYSSLQSWLDSEGIFRTCPVPGYIEIYDNFGAIVRLPHVPVHRHQGDDIQAPAESPIVAPFDGYTSTGRSKLGGLEIRVFGADGYVYNAHLSSLGSLGWVEAGDVIGYVGTTGDATGPHDHFEWHPDDGVAQDPYELLAASCIDAASGS